MATNYTTPVTTTTPARVTNNVIGGATYGEKPTGGTYAFGENLSGGDNVKTIQDLYTTNLNRVGDAEGMKYWNDRFMGDGVIDANERQQFGMAAIDEYKNRMGYKPETETTPTTPPTPATPVDPSAGVAQYTADQTVVDPTKTTGGLLNSLLQEDSDYIKRARALSMEKMTERGLGSSSIAQGAGTAAAIDAALGIATPDAQIYSQTALSNTAAKNQANQFNTGAINTNSLQSKQLANNKDIASMNIEAQKALQMNNQQYTTLTNGSANSLSIMTTLQSKLAAIQMDAVGTAEAKRAAATDAINIAKGAMALIAHTTGDTKFNSALDFILTQDTMAENKLPAVPFL